jgi:methylase of polypeptide subunit release factors
MPADIQRSTEAATALALAQELERGRAQSSAAVAKELVLLMQELRGRSEAREEQEDPLDKLAKLRLVRLSEASGS